MGIYTNTMRYTGTSGVDVESMVQALMKAEGMKSDRLYREKQKLEWTQQMFRDMGTSVKSFSNSYLSFSSTSTIANMRSTAAYSNKSVTGKFSGGDSISTGSSKNTLNLGGNSTIGTTSATAAGDYQINVKSVATADSYKGTAMSSDVISGDDISDIISATFNDPKEGLQAGDYLDVTLNGSTKRLTLTEDDIESIKTAVADGDTAKGSSIFANILQEKIDTQYGKIGGESKVAVSITKDGGQLKFDPKEEIGVTFSITASKTVVNPKPFVFGSVFDGVGDDGEKFIATGTDTYKFSYKGGDAEINVEYNPGDDKQTYVKKLNESISKDSKLKGNVAASLDEDGNVVFKKTGNIPDIKVEGSRSEAGWVGSINENPPGVLTSSDSLFDTFKFSSTASSSTFNVNEKINNTAYEGTSSIKFADGSKIDINIDANTTYKDLMNQVNASGKASLTFNANTNSFSLESKKLGENGAITELPSVFSNAMRLGTVGNDTTHVKATNAEVHVKGPNGIDQTLIRETNTFSYADINFKLDPNLQSKIDAANEASSTKDGLKIEMSVTSDTSQAYDNIKGFIESYNKLMDELSSATNTTRAKSGDYSYYEPLTEAEKEGMTDAQIEKLEGKAKQGMLYRNPELTRLHDKLRQITTTQVSMADGSKMSLAKIGITTGDYTQGGKLFIDEDKLRAALENNPDGVAKLFTDSKNGVAEKMYTAINDAVGSNGYITKKVGFTDSIYVKNNYYSKQIEQKSKELDRVNDYLIGKENYYYRMFANMEKVITESNNQMASLMNY